MKIYLIGHNIALYQLQTLATDDEREPTYQLNTFLQNIFLPNKLKDG